MLSYRTIGDTLNVLAIALNLIMTGAAMLTDKYFDPWWYDQAICADPKYADQTLVFGSTILAASVLGVVTMLPNTPVTQKNAALRAKSYYSLFHAGSHFTVFLLGSLPRLELSLDPLAIGYMLWTFGFWVISLKVTITSLSTRDASIAAVVAIAVQCLLRVPPTMSLIFGQGVFLLAGALDQMFLPEPEKGFAYAAVAVSNLPILAMFALETTRCAELWAPWGGHAIYDIYHSVQPFLLYYAVSKYGMESTVVHKKKV